MSEEGPYAKEPVGVYTPSLGAGMSGVPQLSPRQPYLWVSGPLAGTTGPRALRCANGRQLTFSRLGLLAPQSSAWSCTSRHNRGMYSSTAMLAGRQLVQPRWQRMQLEAFLCQPSGSSHCRPWWFKGLFQSKRFHDLLPLGEHCYGVGTSIATQTLCFLPAFSATGQH